MYAVAALKLLDTSEHDTRRKIDPSPLANEMERHTCTGADHREDVIVANAIKSTVLLILTARGRSLGVICAQKRWNILNKLLHVQPNIMIWICW